MNRRDPYAAGLFYVGFDTGLRRDVEKYLKDYAQQTEMVQARGIVVPHAGYEYSGSVAGGVYGSIAAPKRGIIIGPNHSGFGYPISIEEAGSWKTPLGEVAIDDDLAQSLLGKSSNIQISYDAHRLEHSVEVQLPFLQVITNGDFRFVPMAMKGLTDVAIYKEVGTAIAEAIQETGEDILIIASSDFTHYEPLAVAQKLDEMAIAKIKQMDPVGLLQTVFNNDITMCGPGPVATMLYAAKALGATKGELVKYSTSAEFSMDSASVVGYGGLVVS